MTDTTVEPTVEAPAEEAKTVTPIEQLSPLAQALVNSAKDKAEEIKAVADKQAKVGNVGELLSEAIKSSADPKVKEMLAKKEKAAEAILRFDKEMEAIVKPTLSIPTDEELAGMDAKYKELASQLNTFNTVFSTEVAKDHPEATIFDYVGELPKGRKGAKAGQGTGSVRPRISKVEVTEDQNGEQGYAAVEKDGKSTFTHLALYIKGKTGEVHGANDFAEAWTKQNGVNNVQDWANLPEVAKFNYSVTDKEGKTHTFWVRVTK